MIPQDEVREKLDSMSLPELRKLLTRTVARYNQWANEIDSGNAIALSGAAFDWLSLIADIEKRIRAKREAKAIVDKALTVLRSWPRS